MVAIVVGQYSCLVVDMAIIILGENPNFGGLLCTNSSIMVRTFMTAFPRWGFHKSIYNNGYFDRWVSKEGSSCPHWLDMCACTAASVQWPASTYIYLSMVILTEGLLYAKHTSNCSTLWHTFDTKWHLVWEKATLNCSFLFLSSPVPHVAVSL